MLIVVIASVLILLLVLLLYCVWAAYYRYKRTGKWRLRIPISVRPLSKSAADDIVYPESGALYRLETSNEQFSVASGRRSYTNQDLYGNPYSTLGRYTTY